MNSVILSLSKDESVFEILWQIAAAATSLPLRRALARLTILLSIFQRV